MSLAHNIKLLRFIKPNTINRILSLRLNSQNTNNQTQSSEEGTTHFGFQTVKEEEKQQKGRFF